RARSLYRRNDRFAQQVDPPRVHLHRDRRDATFVLAQRFTAPQRDLPAVQRASHTLAVDDALAERTLLVRALVDQRIDLAAHRMEHGALLTAFDRQRRRHARFDLRDRTDIEPLRLHGGLNGLGHQTYSGAGRTVAR